jgi:hypothetical protein
MHARSRLLGAALCSVVATITPGAQATDPDRVEWSKDWPRVHLVEGLNIIALTAASYAINAHWKPPVHSNWTRPIWFDSWARDEFRGQTRRGQQTARDVGDYLYKGAVLAPYIVDVYVVALGVHESSDVAIQMLLMNLQSLGITGVASLAAERGMGRSRPYVRDCGPDGVVRGESGQPLMNQCVGRNDNQSFWSGHAAATATMAGLTCAHHQHLPLYGGGIADLAPCLLMTGVSVTVGMSRLVSDRHWASDVLVGWGVGGLSGYVLPSLLHYGFGGRGPVGETRVAGMWMVPVPAAYPDGAGLGVVGVF